MRKKRRNLKDLKIEKNYSIYRDLNQNKKNLDAIKNKKWCEELTKNSCLRPDIFLKNRDCDDCPYNKYCIAPNKKFSKHYLKKI
jgi:hypothetical protein